MVANFDRSAWLRAALSAPVAMFHADASGEVQAVNPAWSTLTGLSAEQAEGAGWLDALHPDDRDAARDAWNRATADGDRFEVEFRVLPHAGTPRWVRAIAQPEPAEQGYSGIWLDLTEQKNDETQWRERQNMLEALIANSTDAIYVKDRDGRYLLVNPASQGGQNPGLGLPVGKTDAERFSPETARRLRQIDLEVMETGKPVSAEEVLTRLDGSTRTLSSSKVPYFGEDGAILGVMGISRDITAYKALEAQLRHHESRLEEAQRLGHLGSWEWDLHTHQVTWSEELYHIFGLERTQFAPSFEAYEARIHPDDRERIREIWRQAFVDRKPLAYSYRIIRPDGTTRHLSSKAHVEMDAQGHPVRAFGVALDLTELHEAELELRRSHAILKAEQEADLDGILIVDECHQVLSYNRRFQELWGFPDSLMASGSERMLLGNALTRVTDPDYLRRTVDAIYTDPDRRERFEFRLTNGKIYESYTAPVRSDQGEFFGRVWFFRDITPRKHMEEGLREQNRKLQELDALKSNFVNAISHDLRTPLTSIVGYAEFLEDEVAGLLTPTQHDFVTQIQRSAARLEHLVDDLLDFARMDAGTFKLALKEADLGALARGVISSLRPLAEEAQVTIVDALPEEPLLALFDAARIERVLMNLIGNALKFTGTGGRIEVSATVEDGRIRCAIRDTGIGIAPEDVSKLFQRFSQLSHGMRQANGTGLGLSISKALVDAHGGEIGVDSELGKGSTFWFALPRVAAPRAIATG
ncbi:Histidine protein kinase DivJ [compost metagenome]